ncbi:hypothetical protein QBC36DRAFT_371700, partial [Triangularia setosa]
QSTNKQQKRITCVSVIHCPPTFLFTHSIHLHSFRSHVPLFTLFFCACLPSLFFFLFTRSLRLLFFSFAPSPISFSQHHLLMPILPILSFSFFLSFFLSFFFSFFHLFIMPRRGPVRPFLLATSEEGGIFGVKPNPAFVAPSPSPRPPQTFWTTPPPLPNKTYWVIPSIDEVFANRLDLVLGRHTRDCRRRHRRIRPRKFVLQLDTLFEVDDDG